MNYVEFLDWAGSAATRTPPSVVEREQHLRVLASTMKLLGVRIDGALLNASLALFTNLAPDLWLSGRSEQGLAVAKGLLPHTNDLTPNRKRALEASGVLAYTAGDFDYARECWKNAQYLKDESAEGLRERRLSLWLAQLAIAQERFDEAEELLDISSRRKAGHGPLSWEALAWSYLGRSTLLRGAPDTATQQLERARRFHEAAQDSVSDCALRLVLAELLVLEGDRSQAEELFRTIAAREEQAVVPWARASALFSLSTLLAQRGALGAALVQCAAASKLWIAFPEPLLAIEGLEACAVVLSRAEKFLLTARCLGVAEQRRASLSVPLPWKRRAERNRIENVTREVLGPDRYAWEYRAGQGISNQKLFEQLVTDLSAARSARADE